MGSGRTYLAALAGLHAIGDAAERKRVARQGIAMLAQLAEREPAPLEGIAADELQRAVRAMLGDGLLGELDWLSSAAAAIALFELAQALPPGPERRDLGRWVLTRLREADRETFVRLLVALARSAPKLLVADGLRARAEVVLSAPLGRSAIGELALGLLAQPVLAQSWVEGPATGSLPSRRLAARILAHGAREAVRRHDTGDRGGVVVLARPATRAALLRLLADREALVWRFAGIARGLLAHVDSGLADDIDRELRPASSSTELRRAAASAAAALEQGGAAQRWEPVLVERAAKDPAIARGAILGLAGLAACAPEAADRLAAALIERAPLDGAQALAELRREEATPLLPHATGEALAWLRRELGDGEARTELVDDARWALLHALEAELGGGARTEGIGIPLAGAREALDAGDVPAALRHARAAVEEVTAAADWLERATDDDPIDRRHSARLLRELDRELFGDNTLNAVLALAPEGEPVQGTFARALASIETALLARETRAETGDVPHAGLRIARLRALVRLLDGVRVASEADLGPRLAAMRLLMARAAHDASALRRAVWAALTRAGDALLRDGHAEITDLLLAWTTRFPGDDFAIVREASMVPEVEAAFDAYARLAQAAAATTEPDRDAVDGIVERVTELAAALPAEQSPRVEAVRLALARLGNHLARIVAAASQSTVPADALEATADELGALARRTFGARQRLGLPATEHGAQLEAAVRAIGASLGRGSGALDEPIAHTIEHARQTLPPALALAIERIGRWLAARPHTEQAQPATTPLETMLPSWIPLSRLVGNFYVMRPIGRGAGGSVLLAVRADERTRADRELVALKVPDYAGGGAARNMSEQQFEALFREEAGALLALPEHAHIARFITFDASARPKPLLVMEFVRGTNLERTLETGAMDCARAFGIIDGVLAGLEAMHSVQIAHLDVKPANVVLRAGALDAVLVDFGLAGRRLRPGCGSVHYGAAEVWMEASPAEPFGADVYAAACVAFEVLTNSVLIRGESMKHVIDQHFTRQPGGPLIAALEKKPPLAPLAELLRAAVNRDPKRRPSAARLRAGFAAIAPELRTLPWPIAA